MYKSISLYLGGGGGGRGLGMSIIEGASLHEDLTSGTYFWNFRIYQINCFSLHSYSVTAEQMSKL